jgi:predicted methyltransferase
MNSALKKILLPPLLGLLLCTPDPASAEKEPSDATSQLAKSIAGTHRAVDNRQRDAYRHPRETLEFFGIKDSMTVVEIWPGGKGWYTEILASLLRENGQLYAAHFSPKAQIAFFTSSLKQFRKKLAGSPGVYDKVILTTLQPPAQLEIAPKGTVDMVLTFRNVHNWMKAGQADSVFKAMFDALKPRGILGVVEHRGIADLAQDPEARSGYVTEKHVKKLARRAGFESIKNSEINANPRDTKDHPDGVWTLPPTLRLKTLDIEKYKGIGESDRMTLKFRKP